MLSRGLLTSPSQRLQRSASERITPIGSLARRWMFPELITGGQPLFARHPTGGVVPGGSDKGDTGETYQRTYKTGPKAGTTETVRKAK